MGRAEPHEPSRVRVRSTSTLYATQEMGASLREIDSPMCAVCYTRGSKRKWVKEIWERQRQHPGGGKTHAREGEPHRGRNMSCQVNALRARAKAKQVAICAQPN
jgi:hypothetical protein